MSDSGCDDCGDELLEDGVLYADGQEIVCLCGAVYWVSCDSEHPAVLCGPDDL